jgi:Flp pilus assembly protein TadG
MVMSRNSGRRRRGNSIIEFALLMPWYLFLFVGAYDFGFFSYSLIATQNAARLGAYYNSGSSSAATDNDASGHVSVACQYALDQLYNLPNIGASVSVCSDGTSPVTTSSSLVAGPDGANAASVTVTYKTPQLIPIPGLIPGQLSISRTVQMKLRS